MRTFLTLSFLLGFVSFAQAHAFLDHAEPRVGSTLPASPSAVKIWFTEEVHGADSQIQVFDATQKEVDQKDVKIDAADKTVMSVSVPCLSPGSYKVVWHAVCPFGHHTTGTYTFTVTTQ